MNAELPSMLTIEQAATVADRSPRTLRRWVQGGHLTRHEGEAPEGGGSAPLLIDRQELLGYLATSGAQPRSDTDGQVDTDTQPDAQVDTSTRDLEVEIVKLRAEVELVRLTGEVARLKAELDGVRELLRVEDERRHRAELEVTEARDEVAALRAQLDALASMQGLPWWRRLLGTSPAIPEADA